MRLVPASTLTHASSYRSEESARAQPKPFRLMDLPGELRDIIYGFVVTRNHPICPHRLLREQEGQEGVTTSSTTFSSHIPAESRPIRSLAPPSI